MSELKGIGYLRTKLALKRNRGLTRYRFYEMKNITIGFGIADPPEMKAFYSVLGWCSKAVDSIADRLVFRGFRNDNYEFNRIFQLNNQDILSDSAVLSAAITSCCFIYIYEGSDGFPRMQVVDGTNATGILDPVTGLLKEGYAVLERTDSGSPTIEAYFIPGSTEYFYSDGRNETITNTAPAPLLVPVIYRPDARREFGHSRISRACMSIMESALRTIKRAEISSEFYSFPQKYVLGLSEDAEPIDKWKATMSAMMVFTKDEDGDSPTLGQFSQQSMAPYLDELKTFAALFAGETGLTLDDLGFATENPSSAEAIKAAHENLRLAARKAQRTFGSGFLNAGYLAACVRDKVSYSRSQIYSAVPLWEPIFEPDAAALSGIGDGAIKINQAVPGYFAEDNLRDLTGISSAGSSTVQTAQTELSDEEQAELFGDDGEE